MQNIEEVKQAITEATEWLDVTEITRQEAKDLRALVERFLEDYCEHCGLWQDNRFPCRCWDDS